MDAPTPALHPPRQRWVLVVAAILADFTWIATHIPVLAALGLDEGEVGFYVAYQAIRCLVAGIALIIGLRSGWFHPRELGIVARHAPALRWLAKTAGIGLAATGALLLLAFVAAPTLVCDLAERALRTPVGYSWELFVRDTLCMVLVAPLYEEVVYRALLLSMLRDYLKNPHALMVGGGVFMVLHFMYGYGWNSGYLLVALVLGWVFIRTGSLLPSILLHAANNLWFTTSSYARHALGDAALLGWLCDR